MLKNYIITALRNLWRNKFFSFINIFGLSLGIACCMLIFLYAKDERSFDRFHAKGDQIYHLNLDMIDAKGESHTSSTGMMPGPAFKKNIPEIEDFVRLQFASCEIRKDKDIISQEGLWVDDNFLTVFSFPVLYGNGVNPLKEFNSVVISEDLAKKYFGKSDAVGQTLHMNADSAFTDFKVTAVLKNPPLNSSIKPQMLLPMKLHQLYENDTEWMNSFLNTFVVLRPGADVKVVTSKCNSIYLSEAAVQIKEMREKYEFNDKFVYQLQPLHLMHLDTVYPAGNGLSNASNPVYSYILIAIAGFILLIACINFVNLTVARSLKRAKEIGIRKVIGSQRKQLIFQFLGESFVMSLFSFLLALLLVVLGLPFFNSVSGKELSFSYLFDLNLIFGYVALFLVTGFLAGSYPALVLSSFNPVETLYGKLRYSGKNYLSKGLVVLQFTLAGFFIIATLAIYSQFDFMIHYDLGYDKDNVIAVQAGNMNANKLQSVKNELLKEPAIQQVSGRQMGEHYTIAHVNGNVNQEFKMDKIDEEYFPLFKIPIVQGRNFSRAFPSDSAGSAIVNEKFVKEAGWKNPIGEIIDFHYNTKKYTVIGVVKNFQTGPLTQELKAQFFNVEPQMDYSLLHVKINPAAKKAALQHIEKTVKAMFPAIPYQYSFLDEDVYKQYESEEKWKQIVSFSALLTIFISCIGLFGMAALSAEKRAKEMGIRKVLGASVVTLVNTLVSDFLKLIFIAACISVPLAWWAIHKWLELYAYRMTINASLFFIPLIIIVCLALITVSYQAIRSALSNPVNSLRSE